MKFALIKVFNVKVNNEVLNLTIFCKKNQNINILDKLINYRI